VVDSCSAYVCEYIGDIIKIHGFLLDFGKVVEFNNYLFFIIKVVVGITEFKINFNN